MKNEHSPIHTILDTEKWQRLQDAISLSTKVAIITTDYKGVPVTDHSGCCEFCRQIREDPEFASYCQRCDSRAGLEAVRTDRPYIYFCHFDIIDVAIPIIVDDKYIGAVMAGQVKLAQDESAQWLEHMTSVSDARKTAEKLLTLKAEYDAIPALPYEQIKAVSEMLFMLSKFIMEQALEKKQLLDRFSGQMQSAQGENRTDAVAGYRVENIRKVRKEVSNRLIDAYVSDAAESKSAALSPLLQPAIEYINSHKGEKITLKAVSSACHISPSYFSRMFYRETGENFSNYLASLKISYAKKLLSGTDMAIYQISETLGFSDPSYFIKSFKAQIGMTPNAYRTYSAR